MSTTKVRMNLIIIYTPNIFEVKRFYEIIGLEFKEEKHGTGPTHYSSTTNDGLVLEIYPRLQSSNERFGFELYNLRAVVEMLSSYHITEFSNYVVVRDPDNRQVHLSERK